MERTTRTHVALRDEHLGTLTQHTREGRQSSRRVLHVSLSDPSRRRERMVARARRTAAGAPPAETKVAGDQSDRPSTKSRSGNQTQRHTQAMPAAVKPMRVSQFADVYRVTTKVKSINGISRIVDFVDDDPMHCGWTKEPISSQKSAKVWSSHTAASGTSDMA